MRPQVATVGLLAAVACSLALVPPQLVARRLERSHKAHCQALDPFEEPIATVSPGENVQQPLEDEEECEIDLETMQPLNPDKCM